MNYMLLSIDALLSCVTSWDGPTPRDGWCLRAAGHTVARGPAAVRPPRGLLLASLSKLQLELNRPCREGEGAGVLPLSRAAAWHPERPARIAARQPTPPARLTCSWCSQGSNPPEQQRHKAETRSDAAWMRQPAPAAHRHATPPLRMRPGLGQGPDPCRPVTSPPDLQMQDAL